MARLSKQPLETFKINLGKARGLAQLQYVIDDFIETGGKKIIGPLQDFVFDLISMISGMNREEFEASIEEVIAQKFATAENLSNDEAEMIGKEILERYKPQIESILSAFQVMDFLRSRVLLEHAITAMVTALEVYCDDATVSAIELNPFIEHRFHKDFKKDFGYDNLKSAGYSSRKALGLFVASRIDFGRDVNCISTHFKQMLAKDSILKKKKVKEKLGKIIDYRNQITHQGGIVDCEFKRKTEYRGRIGEPIILTRKRVNEWISFIDRVVCQLDIEIRNTKNPKSMKP